MRPFLLTPTLCTLVALGGADPIQAQTVPPSPQLATQGRLLEGGAPVTGVRSFVFSILDAGGQELWNSGAQSLIVNAGLYSVVLGANGMPAMATSVLAQNGLKLHVSVGGSALSPDVDLIPALQSRSAWEVTGAFGGDLSGTQNELQVTKLQGLALDLITTAPTTGQALVFDGTQWVPGTVAGSVGPVGPIGPQGPQGPMGATGAPGAQGIQGPVGPAGATGATGGAGVQGANGKSILSGSGSPVATGALGAVGDFYLDTLTSMLHGPKTGSTWSGVTVVSLTGPAGPTGTAGVAGPQGPAGPMGATGATGGVGAQGPQGVQGVIGLTGPQGPSGVSLPSQTGNAGKALTTDGTTASWGNPGGTVWATSSGLVIPGASQNYLVLTGNAQTVSLPSPGTFPNRVITILAKYDPTGGNPTSFTVTGSNVLTAYSQFSSGSITYESMNNWYGSAIVCVSDGSRWYVQ